MSNITAKCSLCWESLDACDCSREAKLKQELGMAMSCMKQTGKEHRAAIRLLESEKAGKDEEIEVLTKFLRKARTHLDDLVIEKACYHTALKELSKLGGCDSTGNQIAQRALDKWRESEAT